jgi:hypothetical protein
LKRKHAMEAHEERCYANPVNDRPCLHCKNLERKEIEYYSGFDDYMTGEPTYRKGNAFYCTAKNILLLHPKTEYLNNRFNLNYVIVDNKETEQQQMPLSCEIFNDTYPHYYDINNNKQLQL